MKKLLLILSITTLFTLSQSALADSKSNDKGLYKANNKIKTKKKTSDFTELRTEYLKEKKEMKSKGASKRQLKKHENNYKEKIETNSRKQVKHIKDEMLNSNHDSH